MKAEQLAEAPMTRRDQHAPPLRVRTSYETTRYSSQWLSEAFERLLPRVERRLAPSAEPATEAKHGAPGRIKEVRSQ